MNFFLLPLNSFGGKMAKLHQVLAVEKDIESTAKKIIDETRVVFTKKIENFQGGHKTLEMFDDERQMEAASLEEHKEVTITVPERLFYTADFLIRHYNSLAQKECTNQEARADVIIDEIPILKNVPATLLLALERELVKFREICNLIPTHQPGIVWVLDKDRGKDIYRANRDIKANRTEKTNKPVELSPATKEHKAQVQLVTDNVVIGTWTTTVWTGTISPARKYQILNNIEKVVLAVKKARTIANETEIIENCEVGKQIFDYILGLRYLYL